MRWKNRIAGLTVAALALGAAGAQAQVATGNLGVRIAINAGCTVGAFTDVNFGNQTTLASPVDAQGSVAVVCTDGLPYTVSLGTGQNGDRFMKLTTGPTLVDYELYTDAARTTVFGDNAVNAVGNGATQTYIVYGRVPSQATPGAGVYTDTVVASFSF
jgi:spore coat protein U-like protein